MAVNLQTGVVNLDLEKGPALGPDDTSTFTQVSFAESFPEGSQVIVVPMTQTFHGPDTPGLRIADVTTTGFKIKLNEVVVSPKGRAETLSNGTHVSETIGWAAYTVGVQSQPDPKPKPQSWTGTLDATSVPGVTTGVILHKKDVISISVTGSARLGPASQWGEYGPDGMPGEIQPNSLLPSANCGAVLMQIGSGPLRVVGSGLSDHKVEEDGEIAFKFNDVPTDDFATNSGSFKITLTY